MSRIREYDKLDVFRMLFSWIYLFIVVCAIFSEFIQSSANVCHKYNYPHT